MEKTPDFDWEMISKDKWAHMSADEKKQHIKKQHNQLNEFKRNNNIQNSQNSTSNNQATSKLELVATQNSKKEEEQAGSVMHSILSNNCAIQQNLTYPIQKNHTQDNINRALVDQGANGGFSGGDMLQLAVSDTHKVDVVGIKESNCTDLPMSTCAARIMMTNGPSIGIFHQYAWY